MIDRMPKLEIIASASVGYDGIPVEYARTKWFKNDTDGAVNRLAAARTYPFGSPTALHLTGKLFGEQEILTLAHAFQGKSDFHLQHPRI